MADPRAALAAMQARHAKGEWSDYCMDCSTVGTAGRRVKWPCDAARLLDVAEKAFEIAPPNPPGPATAIAEEGVVVGIPWPKYRMLQAALAGLGEGA